MSIFIEFAKKYFSEAELDYKRAVDSIDDKDYPRAIFYAQQCVEKCVKAMLEVKRKVVYNHGLELISIFIETFSSEWIDEYKHITEALEYLSEYYTRSRYPFLFKGKIYSPSEVVDYETAKRGIEKAGKVLEVVRDYLRRNNVI